MKKFLKPCKPGARVRDPFMEGMPLLRDEGEWKPVNVYWLRRLRFGDVVEAQPEAASKPELKALPKKGDK